MDKSKYPEAWDHVAKEILKKAGWKCLRCRRPQNCESGHCLTIHHWDGDPENCDEDNLVALCERCSLQIQACRDDPDQMFFVPAFNVEWISFLLVKRSQEKRG